MEKPRRFLAQISPLPGAAALFLLLHAPAAAQAIRGTVLDDLSLAPITNATVRLVRGNEMGPSTETDEQGRFLLPVPGPARRRSHGPHHGRGPIPARP